MSGCCATGPGYASPIDAMKKGPREALLYTTVTHAVDAGKHDYLATVDVDPKSPTFAQVHPASPPLLFPAGVQVIHRTKLPNVGDEAHHSGWNACSSCFGDAAVKRSHLLLPCLNSSRVYVIDTAADPRAPALHKTIETGELANVDASFPHTAHCLADGNVLVSTLGDANGNAKGLRPPFFALQSATLLLTQGASSSSTARRSR